MVFWFICNLLIFFLLVFPFIQVGVLFAFHLLMSKQLGHCQRKAWYMCTLLLHLYYSLSFTKRKIRIPSNCKLWVYVYFRTMFTIAIWETIKWIQASKCVVRILYISRFNSMNQSFPLKITTHHLFPMSADLVNETEFLMVLFWPSLLYVSWQVLWALVSDQVQMVTFSPPWKFHTVSADVIIKQLWVAFQILFAFFSHL